MYMIHAHTTHTRTHVHTYVQHTHIQTYTQSADTLAFRPSGPHQYSAHVLLYVRIYESGHTIEN